MRTEALGDLPIEWDTGSHQAVGARLREELRRLIDQSLLPADAPLPSTRQLALSLGVSRGTVVSAYEQLTGEGYLVAALGSGTRVNPRLSELRPAARAVIRAEPVPAASRNILHTAYDLTPERPTPTTLATARWRGAWRRASALNPGDLPSGGLPALRLALSEHLRETRGLVRPPEHYLVTAGAREGLSLVRGIIGAPGRATRVGFEQPGHPSLRRTLERLGCEMVGLPLGGAELLPSDLLPLDAVIVTPGHQYPLGGSLPRDRRLALIRLARATDTIIIEDDYDSELRYAGHPLPALSALDHPDSGCVVTLGTFSKTLAAEVATGYLVAPARLVPALRAARSDLGQPVAAITQAALADYLSSGELRRHIARMRRVYRRRRDLIGIALRDVPGIRVAPMDGGLHGVIETAAPEADAAAACARGGVLVSRLSDYWGGNRGAALPSSSEHPPRGIVIGFAHPDDDEFAAAIALLADALRGVHGATARAGGDSVRAPRVVGDR